MKLTNEIDAKLAIYDIETAKGCFDIGIYNPDTKEWIEFEISKYRNDLYSFVKFYTSNDYDYWVSFNGIGFDHQVLQYIVNDYQKWFDLSGHQIAGKIAAFGTKIIENQNYNIQPPYKENQFPVKCIDLFKIHHFDNEAKRTSLKWCEFMMNMDVEEMPIHHTVEDFTIEMIEELKAYRKHDVLATYELLKLTLGDVNVPELADFKDANKIQARMDIEKGTGLKCMNWSDVKIGEEMNKMKYMKAKGIKQEWDLIPKKVKHPYGQKFKNFFPKTMQFQTEVLKKFIETLGNQYVLGQKQEFPIKIGNTTYTIAKGGIHSTEKNRGIVPIKGYKLSDADVGAQYPNSIIKLGVYPPHLDSIILDQFKETVELKDVYKEQGKKVEGVAKRFLKSLEGLTKLQMNGGYYGKLGQKGSFLEYPEGVLKVCMGNQIEILMLIEALEMVGMKVVSGNTDGILTYYPEDREKEYLEICNEWEKKVGNNILGKLEFAEFAGMWSANVNNYIGKKIDGSVKKKGSFVTVYGNPGNEMNKNKSGRIIPLALEDYFINNGNPINFITNHTIIYDFCIAKKAWMDLHYEELIPNAEPIIHKKLIRYFVSTDGHVFKKRGLDQYGNTMDNHCEAQSKDFPWMKQPLLTYFNRAYTVEDFKEYNIDYKYYILKTLERIDNIEKTNKAKAYADTFKAQKQLTMF